jgi:signal peptidase I
MIVCSALMIWRFLMLATLSESPVVVVLSGSMEPGFRRGDILFLNNNNKPLRSGDIVVFNIDGRSIPIVHRALKVHERAGGGSGSDSDDSDSESGVPAPAPGDINLLTKGDNNWADDIGLYAPGQRWLERQHVMGRVVGYLPYLGMVTIIMNDYPWVKALLIGGLGIMVLTTKE